MHKNIKILLAASTLIHSGVNLLAPVYAIFLKEINGTLLETGLAVGLYTVLRGIFYIKFANIKPNVISHRTMMVTGYVMMGIVYCFYPAVSELYQVFILQACLSLSESVITPSWSASIAEALEKGEERQTYSNFYGYRSLFEGAAAIIGGYIAMELGFNVIFFAMAGCALASAAVVCMLEDIEPQKSLT